MRFSKLVVVGMVGIVSFAASAALAQEAPPAIAAASGISFIEPKPALRIDAITLQTADGEKARFANLASVSTHRERNTDDAQYELSVIARAAGGFDVSLAQRAGVGFDASGDVARESRASELRLGRGLQQLRDEPSEAPTWYFFAASEDEALIWRPGQRNAFGGASGGFALQDRVEIGDLQAGVTYEFRGIQASLAYVEREINVRSGSENFSQDERFVGITLTMRR
jgi:hypothetical protein